MANPQGPPFTNVPPNPIGPQSPQNLLDQFEQVNDLAEQIHNKLLDQVKALKAAREETKNVYDLQDQLNKLLKQEEDIAKAKKNIEDQATGEAQKMVKAIQEGFEARRKQGEELTKFQKLQNAIQAAELSANANTQQGQDLIADLRTKALAQEQKILDLKNKEETLSTILSNDYIKNNQLLDAGEKKLVQQYLNQQKLGEELEEYLKNHNIDLKTQQSIIDAQKAQMSNWQLLNQKIDNLLGKVKSIKVLSETIDWGKKQLDAIGISFTAILTSVLAYGKTITDAAKGLGISVDGVRELAEGYEETAMHAKSLNGASNAAFLTIKNQLQAQAELNKALGTSGLVTAQARVDQVTLTKQMGLQAEEAANLYKIGLLNGKSANDVSKTTAQQVINLRQQKGINLDLKQVLIDVGKVSGQLAAQYKNNPELLAKAVVQAKELGLTLEQTAAMGDKLLDFPGSIESELKAELLTGKALNLEQARYLALMGDSAGAAKELMNNVGGLEEFQKLNVLQQRALAEAVGMTKDELADSLKQQELLKGSGFASEAALQEAIRNADTQEEKAKILAQIKQSDNAEQLLQQYEQISAQEKFNQSIEKLKEMLANMVDGPFGKFLEGLADAVSSASVLKGIMYAIGGLLIGNMIKGIASFGLQMAAAIAPTSAVAAANIASASAITLGVGALAIIAGITAGIMALNSATGENISVSQASGGASGGVSGVNAGGGINVPKEKERPIVVEANINNKIAYNNRTIQEQNTVATMGTNNKTA
jgi:hypothetical protein